MEYQFNTVEEALEELRALDTSSSPLMTRTAKTRATSSARHSLPRPRTSTSWQLTPRADLHTDE